MKNIVLLEKQIENSAYHGPIQPILDAKTNFCSIVVNGDPITLSIIYDLIAALFWAVHANAEKEIFIVFVGQRFDEKLTYILLECYLEHIIADHNVHVQIHLQNNANIFTHGMMNSPLQKLCSESLGQSKVFSQSFRNDIGITHYRKLFSPEEGGGDTLSAALTNLFLIFRAFGIPSEQANSFADITIELVGNALEHAQSECFLDVDIADNYVRIDNPTGRKYYGVNLCVLNFSPALLSSGIQNKLCVNPEIDFNKGAIRYRTLREIYAHQRRFFTRHYGDEEFFMLSAFQHKISGRPNEYVTGGTGLPMLIKSLEQQSETNNCYVVSGRRKMKFIQGLLEYDDNQWLGMNKQRDFAHFIPDSSVFSLSPIYYPGTAYNLNFVIPKET